MGMWFYRTYRLFCAKKINSMAVFANGIATIKIARLGSMPASWLHAGHSKIICSFPRIAGSTTFEELYKANKIALELVPQGTLAERIRAAGAGIPAFYTATGVGTELAKGKKSAEFDGKTYLLETALKGDIALIEAWKADRWGNLTYRQSGRNFNPIMATAARTTIVQSQHIAELGELDPETIVTPGIFVERVVHIPHGDPQG